MDEGAGTLKFIKIKNFIRSNSGWRVHRAVLAWLFLSSLRRSGGTCSSRWVVGGGRAKPGRGHGRRATKREREREGCTFPSKHPKGIIIISREPGLLKRKQTPLPGKNRLRGMYYPSCWKLYSTAPTRLLIFGGNFASLLSSPLRLLPARRPREPRKTGNSNRNWEKWETPVEIEHRILYEYSRSRNLRNFWLSDLRIDSCLNEARGNRRIWIVETFMRKRVLRELSGWYQGNADASMSIIVLASPTLANVFRMTAISLVIN